MDLLEHPRTDYPVPVDVVYANGAQSGDLNVYMSPLEYCIQDDALESRQKTKRRDKATPWIGLYYHSALVGRRVDEIRFKECPNKL